MFIGLVIKFIGIDTHKSCRTVRQSHLAFYGRSVVDTERNDLMVSVSYRRSVLDLISVSVIMAYDVISRLIRVEIDIYVGTYSCIVDNESDRRLSVGVDYRIGILTITIHAQSGILHIFAVAVYCPVNIVRNTHAVDPEVSLCKRILVGLVRNIVEKILGNHVAYGKSIRISVTLDVTVIALEIEDRRNTVSLVGSDKVPDAEQSSSDSRKSHAPCAVEPVIVESEVTHVSNEALSYR